MWQDTSIRMIPKDIPSSVCSFSRCFNSSLARYAKTNNWKRVYCLPDLLIRVDLILVIIYDLLSLSQDRLLLNRKLLGQY